VKVLCLIPARAGSKGVPLKNIRPLGGRPLLAWSILAARPSITLREHAIPVPRYDTRIVVSTDSEQIAAVARLQGTETIMRPAELATDEAATDPVLVHALDELRPWRPDLVVLLQPTCPVRRVGLVEDCIARLLETGADSLLTAYPLHYVWWKETAGPDNLTEAIWRSQCDRRPRRQDMDARELMWHEDGSVYVTRTELLEKTGKRLGGRIEVFENMPSVDIDAEQDIAVAQALLRHQLMREAVVA
jgi:CMP-N,N'-diacetyllegionaminic acid synthase